MAFIKQKKTAVPPDRLFRHAEALRLSAIIVIALFMSVMLGGVYLIYDRVTETLEQAETLLSFGAGGVRAIDFKKLERVTSAWSEKHTALPEVDHDPFISTSSSQP